MAPVRWPELLALLIAVVLCDMAIYRGQGYFGISVLAIVLPLLLWLGSPVRHGGRGTRVMMVFLVGVAVRLAWCGSTLALAVGVASLIGFTMSLAGLPPYMTRMLGFGAQLISAGHRGLNHYAESLERRLQAIQLRRAIVTREPSLTRIGPTIESLSITPLSRLSPLGGRFEWRTRYAAAYFRGTRAE